MFSDNISANLQMIHSGAGDGEKVKIKIELIFVFLNKVCIWYLFYL